MEHHRQNIRRPDPPRLLRGRDVYGERSITGLSKSSIYRLAAAGLFPAGFLIAKKSRVWREDEILEWIAARERGEVIAELPEKFRGHKKNQKTFKPFNGRDC